MSREWNHFIWHYVSSEEGLDSFQKHSNKCNLEKEDVF